MENNPPKPKVRCPLCEGIFDVRGLSSRRIKRNKYGIDVFSCPHCQNNIKIDPYEYAGFSQIIQAGALYGVPIEAYPEDKLMPSEKKAKKGWFSRFFR